MAFSGNSFPLTSGVFNFCGPLVTAFSPVTSAPFLLSQMTCSSPSTLPQAVCIVTGSLWPLGKWLSPLAGALAWHFLFPLTQRAPWKTPVPPSSSGRGPRPHVPLLIVKRHVLGLPPDVLSQLPPAIRPALCFSPGSLGLRSSSASVLNVLVFTQFCNFSDTLPIQR